MHDIITYCGQLYFQRKLVCLTCVCLKKMSLFVSLWQLWLWPYFFPYYFDLIHESFNNLNPILHEITNFSILGLETKRSKKSFWNHLSKVKLSAVLVLVNLEVEVMSQGTKAYLHTVFTHIDSAETILFWIWKSKGHIT